MRTSSSCRKWPATSRPSRYTCIHTYIHAIHTCYIYYAPYYLLTLTHPNLPCPGRSAHRGSVRHLPGEQHGRRERPELLHTAQEGCVSQFILFSFYIILLLVCVCICISTTTTTTTTTTATSLSVCACLSVCVCVCVIISLRTVPGCA